MASPNFPSTGLVPNVTTFNVGDIQYLWDGEKWNSITADLSAGQISAEGGDTVQVNLNKHEALDVANLIANGYSGNYGFFEKGFNYLSDTDLGVSADGKLYKYIGSAGYPVHVLAGRDPIDHPTWYEEVKFNDARGITTKTEGSVQDFVDSFALEVFQSPTDGLTKIKTRTLLGGDVYEVRKVSDDSLATIYSDKKGLNPIAQNGTSNVSGSDGVVEFYVADGDYYVEVDSVKSNFLTLYNKAFVTPAMYGLVEGYDAGNAEKIENMIASGYKIKWGSKSYGVDRCIGGGSTLLGTIDWESDGCEIFLDSSSSHQQAVVWYEILPVHQNISGSGLTFNANYKANVGAWFENKATPTYPIGYGSTYFERLKAEKILRINGVEKGDGILIEGAFFSQILESPVVESCEMEVGAGNPLIQGITGISILPDVTSGGFTLYSEIRNPKIDSVKSLDATYNNDQDGIRVFGGRLNSDLVSTCMVIGGRMSNCFGRSIKGQVTSLKVKGTTFHRDDGWSNSLAISEVVNQYGKADIEDINCDYFGLFTASSIIGTSSTPFSGEDDNSTAGSVDGVNIKMRDENAVVNEVISTFSNLNLGAVEFKNIVVDGGSIDRYLMFHCGQNTDSVTLKNCTAYKINVEGIRVLESAREPTTVSSVDVFVENVKNFGTERPLCTSRVSGNAVNSRLSCGVGIIGFTGDDRLAINEGNQPILTRVDGLAGQYTQGTYMKIFSESIAANSTYEFPSHGYSSGSRKALINANISENTIAEVFCSENGIVEVFSGNDINVGNTSEPAGSEDMKCWINNITGGLVVLNNTPTSKVVTIYYF